MPWGLSEEETPLGIVRKNEMAPGRGDEIRLPRRRYRDYKEPYPGPPRTAQIEQDHFRIRTQAGSAADAGVNTPFV